MFWQQLGAGIISTLILVLIGLGQCALVWLLKKKTELQISAANLQALLAQQTARKAAEELREAAEKVAEKVTEVKDTLEVRNAASEAKEVARDKKLEQIEVTGKATHVLVNSQRGAALRIAAVALRTLAETTNTPAHARAAEAAEAELEDHEAKQRMVDREQDQNRAVGKPTA